MAEIRDELVLEIDQALRQIDDLERALDRSLGAVEVRVDATQAQRQIEELGRDADRALGDVDLDIDATGAARLNNELAGVERNLSEADIEADQLAGSLREADRAADSINTTTRALPSRFAGLQTAALGLASAFAAIGIGQVFSVAIRGANSAIQSFAQLEDSVNAVNVVFGQGARAVLEFGETAAESAGLSQQAFNAAVVPIGSLLQNFGFDAQAAANASVILVQRAADLASVMGGSVQDALLAVGAALRGEADPLERYGASISAARVEQFALAEGLARTKAEITPAITLQARYGLILADTQKVQGDFVATADDLANAQKSAGAAAADFATDIGEALAPAMEVLVGLVPELIEGLRQLVPEFAAGADASAAFLASIGDESGPGFRTFVASAAATGSVLKELALGLGDVGSAIFEVARTPLTLFQGGNPLEQIDAQLQQFDTRIARTVARQWGVALARSLDAGEDAATSFGEAIAALGNNVENIEVFEDSFKAFALQANLTDVELQDVTRTLITNAEALNLSAEEVAFLTTIVNGLNEAFDDGGRANADYLASVAGFPGVFDTTTTTFTTFAGATEDAQTRASAALTKLAEDSEAQLQRAATAFDLFADAPDAIKESFASAVAELSEQVADTAAFEANLARLGALGFDALKQEFEDQGPAAATQLRQALANLDLARDADLLLQGIATTAIEGFGEDFVEELVNLGISQKVAEELAATLTNQQVIDAVTAAGNQAAVAGVTSYGVGIETEVATFAMETDFANLLGGALTNEALLASLYAAGAAGAQAYEDGFRGPRGLNADSPSKAFMEVGKDAADGFIMGWDQNATTLRVPETGVTGNLMNTTAATNTGSGINVTLITNNPTQQDEVSDVARMGQIASSVAASYRSVVPNAM